MHPYLFTTEQGPAVNIDAYNGQKITLNIGLIVAGTADYNVDLFYAINVVHHALRCGGFIGGDIDHVSTGEPAAFASNHVAIADEPTLIIRTYYNARDGMTEALATLADYVCRHLEQDCIAVRVADNLGAPLAGALLGPNAAKWGEFNPAKFVTERAFTRPDRARRYAAITPEGR